MGAIWQFGVIVKQEFVDSQQRLLGRQMATIRSVRDDEKATDDPLLEDYDATTFSSGANEVDNP